MEKKNNFIKQNNEEMIYLNSTEKMVLSLRVKYKNKY